MAYFGGIFFANMGGGGGQNYFQCVARLKEKFLLRSFPEPPTPGIFSKVSPLQMGGVLRYK